jgi:hypothetical protein
MSPDNESIRSTIREADRRVSVMASETQIQKLKEFILVERRGAMDGDGAKQLITQLALVALLNPAKNLLLDLRNTTLTIENTGIVFNCAAEFARYKRNFRHKIANVIPDDEERVSIAKRLKALIDLETSQYQVFTRFEDALDWVAGR